MYLHIMNYFDAVFHNKMALCTQNTIIFLILLAKLHHRSGCFIEIAAWVLICGDLELQKI